MVCTKTNIPERLEDYIAIEDEDIFVNWSELGKLKRKVSFGDIDLETFNLIYDDVLRYLLDTEILTFSRKNTWRVVAIGGDFGPKTSYGQDHMNFTRERDAREYKKAFHRDTIYDVGIEKPT